MRMLLSAQKDVRTNVLVRSSTCPTSPALLAEAMQGAAIPCVCSRQAASPPCLATDSCIVLSVVLAR